MFYCQNINNDGVRELVEGISECRELKSLTLNLYKNPIKYEGAVAIFENFVNW